MVNRIHHIGITTPSIQKALEFHVHALGMKQVSNIIHDTMQQVKVLLLGYDENQTPDSPLIELAEPVGSSTPLNKILRQKNLLYHYCIEVPSLEDALVKVREKHAIIIQRPVPAALFNGRRIAFVWTPNKYLLEFLEL